MATVENYYINILENSTVTLTAGTAHADFPLARLYDRDIGRDFKTTAAVTTTVHIDHGATGNLAIDQLFIPAGHGLNGMTLDIEWSDNDSSWTPAVTQWVQGDANLIDKSWTSITHRYWRFTVTSPASAPQFAELFLTQTYTWEKNPLRNASDLEAEFNVIKEQTASGEDMFLKLGESKRSRLYQSQLVGLTQKTNIEAVWDAWAGYKPFFMQDHRGNIFFVKFNAGLNITEVMNDLFRFTFDVTEVIA
jgi:hypothetical protein